MKISEIAKILQVHKSTSGLTNSRGEKCLFHKERKGRKKKVNREIKVEEIQGKTIWEANIEEKFNVIISYSSENSEKKTENSLKTLQDRQANRCRLRERLKGY
jgi:putative transposase